MARYVPIVVGALVIVGLTIPQIQMSDRFAGANVNAERHAAWLEKNVPKEIGDWYGEDLEVTEEVRKTAGAIGCVSRSYRNVRTGDEVKLWLIVGHARSISAHTPNICYRGSGFEARAAENSLYPMVVSGQPDSAFWTNTFYKDDVSGHQLVRVFWSWYNPEGEDNQNSEAGIHWEAPTNPRWLFGNTRALYKMYFTSQMRDPMETTEQSACLRFARDFLPEVNQALAEVNSESTPSESASAGQSTDAAPATTEAAPSETAAGETKAAAAGDSEKNEPQTPPTIEPPADQAAPAARPETPAAGS